MYVAPGPLYSKCLLMGGLHMQCMGGVHKMRLHCITWEVQGI